MAEGARVSRAGSRFAALMLMVPIVQVGCQQLPVPRAQTPAIHLAQPKTDGPSPATKSETAAPAPLESDDLPPLPIQNPAVSSASSTPLLDEALVRAALPKSEEPPSPKEKPTAEAEESEEPSTTAEEPPSLPTVSAPAPDPAPAAAPQPAEIASLVMAKAPQSDPVKAIDPEKPAEKPAEPVKPRDLWKDGLEQLRAAQREHASRPDGDAGPWPVRTLLLDSLDRTGEDSPQAEQYLMRTVMTAMLARNTQESTGRSSRASRIHEAVLALEDAAPLEISSLRLCRKVNGFGDFDPVDPLECRAGQVVIVYCEISGLRYLASDETYRSRLSGRIELLPAGRTEPVWTQSLGTAEDVCHRRRRDYYVNYRVTLPDHLPAGPYTLRVFQNDEVAGRSTSAPIDVTIRH